MMLRTRGLYRSVCAETDETMEHQRKHRWLTWIFPVGGLLALLWFLLRVIPKPSRATYPCQRAAFPLASGFVIWLVGVIGSVAAFRRARRCLIQSRYVLCAVLLAVSIGSMWVAQSFTAEELEAIRLYANRVEPLDPTDANQLKLFNNNR